VTACLGQGLNQKRADLLRQFRHLRKIQALQIGRRLDGFQQYSHGLPSPGNWPGIQQKLVPSNESQAGAAGEPSKLPKCSLKALSFQRNTAISAFPETFTGRQPPELHCLRTILKYTKLAHYLSLIVLTALMHARLIGCHDS
jgi:hypothetical protein